MNSPQISKCGRMVSLHFSPQKLWVNDLETQNGNYFWKELKLEVLNDIEMNRIGDCHLTQLYGLNFDTEHQKQFERGDVINVDNGTNFTPKMSSSECNKFVIP